MMDSAWNRKALIFILALMVFTVTSCNKRAAKEGESAGVKTDQKTFASPEAAGAALFDAAKAVDRSTLAAIFGPEMKDVLFSGDAARDKEAMQRFVSAYTQM